MTSVSRCQKGLLFIYPNLIITCCQPYYLVYFTEPFFQDGVIAQSANDVAELRGVPYFAAAGNFGTTSWEGTFHGSGLFDDIGCELHAFADGDTRQSVFVDEFLLTIFQWDDPFFSVSGGSGASRDMDFRVYFEDELVGFDIEINLGGDPVAYSLLFGTGTFEFEFSLCNPDTPPPPLMKWIGYGFVSNIEFDTQSSTLFGHANAAVTAGVGAAFFQATPAFGTDPPQLEPFSSRGGTPILFDRFGERSLTIETRMQPRFVATDGCINTFFGDKHVFQPNGIGYYFFGMFLRYSYSLLPASLFVSPHFYSFAE